MGNAAGGELPAPLVGLRKGGPTRVPACHRAGDTGFWTTRDRRGQAVSAATRKVILKGSRLRSAHPTRVLPPDPPPRQIPAALGLSSGEKGGFPPGNPPEKTFPDRVRSAKDSKGFAVTGRVSRRRQKSRSWRTGLLDVNLYRGSGFFPRWAPIFPAAMSARRPA